MDAILRLKNIMYLRHGLYWKIENSLWASTLFPAVGVCRKSGAGGDWRWETMLTTPIALSMDMRYLRVHRPLELPECMLILNTVIVVLVVIDCSICYVRECQNRKNTCTEIEKWLNPTRQPTKFNLRSLIAWYNSWIMSGWKWIHTENLLRLLIRAKFENYI